MIDVVKSRTQQVLESLIADLKKIRAICIHKNLDTVPYPAPIYLVANCDLINYYLRQVYSKMRSDQRNQLLSAHSELHYIAVNDSFYKIAKSTIEKIKKVKKNSPAIKLGLISVTEDDISMLLRALEYAKYCDLDPHDYQLSMSPIVQYGLESHPKEVAYLTDEEKQAVRWDVSDILYSQKKSQAFEECRAFGLEMKEPRGDPRACKSKVALEKGSHVLMELLKEKIKLDFSVVIVAAPNERFRYIDFIKARLSEEYLLVLEALRAALVHLIEYVSPLLLNVDSREKLTRAQKDMILLTVQNDLKTFNQDFDHCQKNIKDVQPTSDIIDKVRRLLPHEKGVTYMGDVYQNIKNSTITSRSVVEIWNQAAKDIDLNELAKDLSRLRSEMRKKASTSEQDMATGKVATAEQCATTGDGAGALQHLKDAGKWALEVATEIGTKLASEALKKAIGL